MALTPTDQCIVLPFRAKNPQPFNGTGLALHFLVGTGLALHTGLKEMWFGWRVKKIFPEKALYQRYCRDAANRLDLVQVSRSRQVRLWIHGIFSDQSVKLHFFDGQMPDALNVPADLIISIDDGLVGFRTRMLKWMESTGWPMPIEQVQAALWPEAISRDGLDAVGRALEEFYGYSAYEGDWLLRDLEETLFWFGRKADVCRQDVRAAREDGRRRYEKVNK